MDEETRRGIVTDPLITRRTRRPELPPERENAAHPLRAALVGVGSVIVFLIAFGAFLALGAFAYYQTLNLIVPGVHVGGVALGGMGLDEAAVAINQGLNTGGALTIAAEDREWQAAPAEFGLTIDAAATAARAAAVGRGGTVFASGAQMLDSALGGRAVEPVVAFDRQKARAALTAWAAKIDKAPQNAALRIEGGQLAAVPGAPGYTLDVDRTVDTLAADPAAALRNGYLPLVLTPLAPNIPDASAALEQARGLTAAPLPITLYDAISDERIEANAAPEEIAGWLTVTNASNALSVSVDADKVAAYLQGLAAKLGQGRTLDAARLAPTVIDALKAGKPALLIVSHLPTTYTVEAGDTLTGIAWKVGMPYWRILEANPQVPPDSISTGETLTIPSKDILLPLPVIPEKRLRLSISDQRLRGYENGQQVFEYVISTGIDRSPTQPGVFQVLTHELNAYASVWDLYMPHFLGIYEAWPGFMNGFHGLPLLHGGTRLWADVLGKPASFGCIILSLEDAESLYTWAQDGVVVEITE